MWSLAHVAGVMEIAVASEDGHLEAPAKATHDTIRAFDAWLTENRIDMKLKAGQAMVDVRAVCTAWDLQLATLYEQFYRDSMLELESKCEKFWHGYDHKATEYPAYSRVFDFPRPVQNRMKWHTVPAFECVVPPATAGQQLS